MARPLPGYSEKGVTFTAPGSVPGKAVDEPLAVTTTASSPMVKAPKLITRAPGESRMPAMPPPERPCGRTPDAGKCKSCPSEAMKQSSSSPVRSSTAPAS